MKKHTNIFAITRRTAGHNGVAAGTRMNSQTNGNGAQAISGSDNQSNNIKTLGFNHNIKTAQTGIGSTAAYKPVSHQQ